MNNEKSSLKASTVILLILLFISTVFVILVETGAFKISRNTNNIVKYESLDDAISNINFNVEIPKFVLETKNLEYRVSNGAFLEIGSKEIVFKAAKFIDYKADPLALYSKSNTDNQYLINESNIDYFRVRLGYENMENCTIINWVQGDTSYGIIFSSIYTEDELLSILGINRSSLVKYEEGNKTIDNIEYTTELIGNKFNVNIPNFKTSFKIVELEGYTICYIDNKKVFVFIYDDYNIDSNTFGGQSEVKIDNNIVLRYLSENPFDSGTLAYDDYNTFIHTINNIVSSIEYQ